MTFKIGAESKFAGSIPRLTFVNPARDGDHIPGNKRFAPDNSWANLDLIAQGAALSITATEGYNTKGGSTSRAVSLSLHPILARQLRDFLVRCYPDVVE